MSGANLAAAGPTPMCGKAAHPHHHLELDVSHVCEASEAGTLIVGVVSKVPP